MISGWTISNGVLHVASSTALGGAATGTQLRGGSLELEGVTVTDETLTNNAALGGALEAQSGMSSGWTGLISLKGDLDVFVFGDGMLTLSGPIVSGGASGINKWGTGTLVLGGKSVNSDTGTTTVNEGTLVLANSTINQNIVGPLVIGDGIGGVNADVVRLDRDKQIANNVHVTINSSGLLDFNGYSDGFGSLSGSGNITSSGASDVNAGVDNSSTSYSGVMSGPLNFWKEGAGTMTLSGNNAHTGTTICYDGILLVNGLQPQSSVVVSNGATLGGSGTVGPITVASGGTLSPGNSPGILTCSGSAVFNSGSIFSVEINGSTAGAGHDQLIVNGNVNLGNATLMAKLGFQSAVSNSFTIINKTGAGAINSAFNGLPDNATLNISGIPFRITYSGGTGNDVTLTQLLPPPTLSLSQNGNTNLVFSWSPTTSASASNPART